MPKPVRYLIGVFAFATAIYFGAIVQVVTVFVFFLGVYSIIKLYTLSKKVMRDSVEIKKLEEGMISAETIIERGRNIEIQKQTGIKSIINYLASNDIQKTDVKNRVIVSSMQAGGLTEEEITELNKLADAGKIPKKIEIKQSAAFVPAVLIAYIMLNIIGDFIWNVIL